MTEFKSFFKEPEGGEAKRCHYPTRLDTYGCGCAHDCKVHCLGMTRKPVLDKVPFDYVDSSSWTQGVLYGRIGSRKLKNAPTVEERRVLRQRQWEAAYKEAMKMQEYYEAKWSSTTRKLKEGLLQSQ